MTINTPNTPLAVLILAAGQGSRMKSSRPKVLHTIAGLPMISHVINTVKTLNPVHIIPILAPHMDEVIQAITPLKYVTQPKPLGTGDAVKCTLNKLKDFKGSVLVLCGDVPLITEATLSKLLATHEEHKYGITVLGMKPLDPSGYGRLIQQADGTLDRIVEHADATEKERSVSVCNSGVMVIDGNHIHKWIAQIENNNSQNEFYLVDLPLIAQKDQYTCGVVMGNVQELQGVNDRAQLAELENLWQAQKRNEIMKSGVTLQNPDTIYFSYDTKIGQDSLIGANTVFGTGVEIADHVEIKPFCHLEQVKIYSGGIIGPFARLRPGTILEKNAKIGNFVEIKNATLGENVKVNHLTYVGDADIGCGSNIGAGTITCNYDGKNKYRTTIGQDVFVGSNTVLIAPITLENGCYIGAGSTLSKDIPSDSLAVARSRTIIKENWAISKKET